MNAKEFIPCGSDMLIDFGKQGLWVYDGSDLTEVGLAGP